MPYTSRAPSTMPVPVVAITDSAMASAIALAQKPPPSACATATRTVPWFAACAICLLVSTPCMPTCESV